MQQLFVKVKSNSSSKKSMLFFDCHAFYFNCNEEILPLHTRSEVIVLNQPQFQYDPKFLNSSIFFDKFHLCICSI